MKLMFDVLLRSISVDECRTVESIQQQYSMYKQQPQHRQQQFDDRHHLKRNVQQKVNAADFGNAVAPMIKFLANCEPSFQQMIVPAN